MSKNDKWRGMKNAHKKKKEERKKRRGWCVVSVQHDCGCCHSEMFFKSEASALDALKKAGLQNSATITDDKGTVHEGIDTFYGMVKT